jgi:RNA polymerase sigma-70 factor (ECF subfamily)
MGRRFDTTRWSLVLAAQARPDPAARAALAALCEIYWEPLYAHVRRRCPGREEAEDLTQAYFARLLEKGLLAGVRPERGRLRSFLLASLDHFLANERDRERALKRGGGRTMVALDAPAADARSLQLRSCDPRPDEEFDRRWALTVLDRALAELRGEHSSPDKARQYEKLEPYLTGEQPSRPHAEVAAELGTTDGAVKTAVHRLRRRLGELLRREVARTVERDDEIDAEIRHLLAVLGRHEPARGAGG